MKVSIYHNPNYCLSFGEDCVFLDVEVKITRLSEAEKVFKAEVTKSQLVPSQEEFPIFLLSLLTTEQLATVMERLRETLTKEIDQSLFSLFYVGEIQKDATNT